MNTGKCNTFQRELSREAMEQYAVPKLPGEAHYLLFVREPVYHFLSQARHRGKERKMKGIDGLLKKGFFNTHARAWHVSNPQFRMLNRIGESMNETLSVIPRLFGVGVTGYYSLSLCVMYFQLYDVLPNSCCCVFSSQLDERDEAGLHKDDVPNKQDYNLSLNQLKRLQYLRRLDQLVYSKGVTTLLARATEVEKASGRSLMCLNGTL